MGLVKTVRENHFLDSSTMEPKSRMENHTCVYCDNCGSWSVTTCLVREPFGLEDGILALGTCLGISLAVVLTIVTGGIALICFIPTGVIISILLSKKESTDSEPVAKYQSTCVRCGQVWDPVNETASPVNYVLTEADLPDHPVLGLEYAQSC